MAAKKKGKNLKIPRFPFFATSQHLLQQPPKGLVNDCLLFPLYSFTTFLYAFATVAVLGANTPTALLSMSKGKDEEGLVERIVVPRMRDIIELYWSSGLGKSTLTRGLPTWFKRHFYSTDYTPKGLVEVRKHQAFTPDSADWFVEEWQAFQSQHDLDKSQYLGVEEYVLTPEEALFLSFAIGAMQIRDVDTDRVLSNQELWNIFCENCRRRCNYSALLKERQISAKSGYEGVEQIPLVVLTSEFAVQYAVYHHFRSKGWVPRSGLNLGFDLLLYKKGPQYSHAEFCVWIIPKTHSIDNVQFLGKVRVASSVKKRVILCFVDIPSDLSSLSCLDQFVVHEFKVSRWIPDKAIDNTPKK